MTDNEKQTIKKTLEALYFVHWDRYVPRGHGQYAFYGWIDREKDNYKDFVLIEYICGTFYWITSSAERDHELEQIIDGSQGKGIACQRIEWILPELTNVIHLKK